MISLQQFVSTLYPTGTPGMVCLSRARERGYSQHRIGEILSSEQISKATWYICLSTVKDPGVDEKGKPRPPRRREGDVEMACVIMLDDVGTKVEVPDLEPTCILETSKGNYQYVYRIQPTSIEDGYVKACIEWLAKNGFTDKGSQGVNRLYRVPGSLHKSGWNCRVDRWNPEKVWEIEDLMKEFGARRIKAKPKEGFDIPDMTEEEKKSLKDPVIDWLQEKGWVHSKIGEWVTVKCPWAHLHSNKDLTAGYSPLGHGVNPVMRGFKCQHEHCIDRRITDYLAWIAENSGPAVPVASVLEFSKGDLDELSVALSIGQKEAVVACQLPILMAQNLPDPKVTTTGKPLASQIPTTDNISYVARQYGIEFRWNVMTRAVEAFFKDEKMNHLGFEPESTIRYVIDGCHRVGISAPTEVEKIASVLSRRIMYHPMQDWIKGKPWDGVSRFEDILQTVVCDPDNKGIFRIYLRRWLIQCVQASCGWLHPKQVGSVLVFSGAQFKGKTTWFSKLVPEEFFTDSVLLNLKWKPVDSIIAATMTPISELGELESTFKRSDTGALKAFLTSKLDTYREPYGRRTIRIPRTTSFCGSVNRSDFLVDETGNRRFWPVTTLDVDLTHQVNLQQLWAEFHHYWKKGEQWWLTTEEYRIHEAQSGEYEVTSDVSEAFFKYYDMFRRQPADDWAIMNISELADAIGLYHRDRGTLSTLKYLVVNHFGKRLNRIDRKQKCWRLPDPSDLKNSLTQEDQEEIAAATIN